MVENQPDTTPVYATASLDSESGSEGSVTDGSARNRSGCGERA
jgi:hypothetical protein